MTRYPVHYQSYSKIRFLAMFLLFYLTGTTVGYTQEQKIKAFVNTLQQRKQFNGSLMVAENDRVLFYSQNGQNISAKSQFPIASVSKTFTSTAILQLKSLGRLDLDESVQKYLPDFPYEKVTTRHLLSNTSGLGQYYTLFDQEIDADKNRVITNQDIIPVLKQKNIPLSFSPGDRWEYNNLNFCIAALIVEKLSGKTFSDYLHTFVFGPSGMEHTFQPVNRRVKSKDQVQLYSYPNLYSTVLKNVDSLPVPFKIEGHSSFYGNGGIVSTAEDLVKFNRALQNGTILAKKELTEAFSPTILNNGKKVTYTLDEKEVSYGLGWEMYTDTTHGKVVFHDGSLTGLTSMLMYNLTTKQAIVMLDNTGSNAVFASVNALMALLGNRAYVVPGRNLPREYASAVVKGDLHKAQGFIHTYETNSGSFRSSERDFIRTGYELLRNNLIKESLTVFDTSAKLYPDSWNVYDSFGEALLKAGDKTKAKEMYQKSLMLNPENKNAVETLQRF